MPNPTQPSAQDPAAVLERVKELQDRSVNYELGKGEYSSFIQDLENAFPSIASLCLEQAEEINRLRGALEEIAKNQKKHHYALAYFWKGVHDGPDNTVDGKIAEQALSPQSK